MDHQVGGVDLISSLPDSILHHILSFMHSPQDLAFTSVLSKKWFEIWRSFPIFKFSQDNISEILYNKREVANPGRHLRDLMAEGGEIVMTYGGKRLASFREQIDLSISSFALQIWPTEAHIPLIDEWVQILVEKNASEIHLFLNSHPRIYALSNRILSSTCLTSLTLDSCSLPANFMSHDVCINSLKVLDLRTVPLSEEALKRLAVVFPSLKELFLIHCLGYTRFVLPLLKKLEKVEVLLESAVLIQLDSPELQHLSYSSGLENVEFKLSSCISKLRTLHVCCITVYETSAFCQLVSSCTVLEELTLHISAWEDKFSLKCLSLKKMILGVILDIQEIRIDAPRLEYFSYDGNLTATTFVFTSQEVKCEGRVSLPWVPENAVAPFLIRLNEFLHRSVKFKVLHMSFRKSEVVDDALYQSILSPFKLDKMVVEYYPADLDYRQIFAAVFCCCKPLSLTIELHHRLFPFGERDDLFKYIYEQLEAEEDEEWERKVHIVARNESHHTRRFASLEEFIRELPALRHDQEVCFKTQRVERVKKKRRIE